MAKIYVQLDPDEPEDKDKLDLMTNGWKFRSALFEMDQYLRNRLKYDALEKDIRAQLQAVRDKLWEIVGELGVEIE